MVDLYDLWLRVQYVRFFVQGKGLHRIFTVQRCPIELHDHLGDGYPNQKSHKSRVEKPSVVP